MSEFKIKPDTGNPEEPFFQADYSGLTDLTEIFENGIFGRLKIEGTFTIYKENEIDRINILIGANPDSTLPVLVYHKGRIFTGVVDFGSQVNNSYNFRDLSVEITDIYTEIEKFKDNGFNLMSVPKETNGLTIETNVLLNVVTFSFTFSDSVTSNGEFGDTRAWTHTADNATTQPTDNVYYVSGGTFWGFDNTYSILEWSLAKATYTNLTITNVTGATFPDIDFDCDLELIIVQEVGRGYYSGVTAYPPDGTGNWVYK